MGAHLAVLFLMRRGGLGSLVTRFPLRMRPARCRFVFATRFFCSPPSPTQSGCWEGRRRRRRRVGGREEGRKEEKEEEEE